MELKKKIKKYGNSNVLLISKEDMEVNNLKPGDILTIIIEEKVNYV
jgi:antitoxin component of MazEF toxin-antitoxin module